MRLSSLFFSAALLSTPALAATTEIQLWPSGAPDPEGFACEPEGFVPPKQPDDGIQRLTNVTDPTLTIYPAAKPNGTAVVVCPGGGYNILAITHEGIQVCEWLNELGVTAALLKYRVPRRDPETPEKWPLQDAQRAISILRSRAGEFGIAPDRIGILGFSAGGNLCLMAALHPEDRTFDLDPKLDAASPAPNFVIPVYPAYLTEGKEGSKLLPDFTVTPASPAICLIHANDDRITAAGSALIYVEYRKLNLPAELHIYERGGHGYGMKPGDLPVNSWPDRVADWMRARGLLDAAK
ncbi:MAG: alpha/beta hydrolase [Verrucomicrobiales bacterium]|nr:alpha/beta hydrolase [Verrucomicrobiales bacterium]